MKSSSVVAILGLLVASACITGPPTSVGSVDGGDAPDRPDQNVVDAGPFPDAETADGELEMGTPLPRAKPPIEFAYTEVGGGTVGAVVADPQSLSASSRKLELLLRVALALDVTLTKLDADFPVALKMKDVVVLGPQSPMAAGSVWPAGLGSVPVVTLDADNWLAMGLTIAVSPPLMESSARIEMSDITQQWTVGQSLPMYLAEREMSAASLKDGSVAALTSSSSAGSVAFLRAASMRAAVGLEAVDALTRTGVNLVANAVQWAMGGAPVPAQSTCQFLVEDHAFDDFLLERRATLSGCATTLPARASDAVAAFDRAEPVAWVVAPSATQLPAGLLEYEGPVVVVTHRSAPLEALKLVRPNSFSTTRPEGTWTIAVDRDTDLTAGHTGNVVVAGGGALMPGFSRRDVAPGAFPVATRFDSPEKLTVWVVETGAELVGGTTAAGPRAVIAIPNELELMTAKGLTFVDAAVQWALAHNAR